MANQEYCGKGILRFVCPDCGSDLLCKRIDLSVYISRMYDDGGSDWGDSEEEETVDYHCGECGRILVDPEGKKLMGEDLVEWLLAHCSQDESDAGPSENRASEVPPSESGK